MSIYTYWAASLMFETGLCDLVLACWTVLDSKNTDTCGCGMSFREHAIRQVGAEERVGPIYCVQTHALD
jgi:hypothetical protein